MHFQVILAHGALGPYDELIMLGVMTIFLVMMGISWVRSRNTRPAFEQAQEDEQARDLAEKTDEPGDNRDNPERFRLD